MPKFSVKHRERQMPHVSSQHSSDNRATTPDTQNKVRLESPGSQLLDQPKHQLINLLPPEPSPTSHVLREEVDGRAARDEGQDSQQQRDHSAKSLRADPAEGPR